MSEFKLETLIDKIGERVFRPIKATEKIMRSMDPVDGCVYFTIDSKKIYLGSANQYLSMGGNSGIYYGRKAIEDDNSGNPDPNVTFVFPFDIEGDTIPMVDDLILNTDGCFYRVNSVDEDLINTTRLTLQGSGTGGGGGSIQGSFSIAASGGSSKYFESNAKVANIGFVGYSSDVENYISKIQVFLGSSSSTGTILLTKEDQVLPMGQVQTIDLSKHLSNFNEYGKRVTLKVEDKYGISREIPYTIYTVDLKLTSSQNILFPVIGSSFQYTASINGGAQLSSSDTKTIYYKIYNEQNLNQPVYEDSYELTTNQNEVTKNIDVSSLPHGSYVFRTYVNIHIGASDQTLNSNTLTYKMLRYEDSVGQPLFSTLISDTVEQYVETPITFLLADVEGNSTYSLEIYLDNEYETSLTIQANTLLTYNLLFESQGNYKFEARIPDLGISYIENINVTKYTGILPVIDTNNEALVLYLNPQRKTNDEINKGIWENYATKYPQYNATLNNFYFGKVNGWTVDKDESDAKCLKLTQGANIISNYLPFATDPIGANGRGMTIELDFKIKNVVDYDNELIKCISKNINDQIQGGFAITGDTIKFYTRNTETSMNLIENKRIQLTFRIEAPSAHDFPMIYTYLNGIISGVKNYVKGDDSLIQSSEGKAELMVDSTSAEIYIYGIRIYTTAIDEATILNNVQASIASLAEREKEYKDNLILNGNKIDLNAIENENYELGIPYVKITGGWGCAKDFTMNEAGGNGKYALPIAKDDRRLVDVEIHYPKTDFFAKYKDFSVKCTFDDETLNVLNGFGKTAKTGAMIYAQGTSSLEYPVKNLRMKFASDKISVRPDLDLAPVKLICFKADYMESSGSHNTGAANFIDTVYKFTESEDGGKMQTPAQKFFEDEAIVTCIKGHPCVIFWSESGEPGTYEYIGKYNLNLDKATPEPFGFKYKTEANVTSGASDEDIKFGYLLKENGELDLNEDGTKKNAIYCFEFLDNKVNVCNFLKEPNLEDYHSTWYKDYEAKKDTFKPGWTKGFESRFPEDKEDTNDADSLYEVASWINELQNLKESGQEERALRRFAAEYKCYFNEDFLLAYYVLTYTLLMADSRVKNMMIATWGKEKRSYIDIDTGEEVPTYNFIWYPIFYDMDTMFGLDNTGVDKFSYFAEDSTESIFNGDEILWKFVRDAIPEKVANMYNKMEKSTYLTAGGIIPYFNDNQADMANETFYNGDAKYKYINPFRDGYTNHLSGEVYKPGTSPRLYAAQGSRSLTREYFIRNRVNFLRGLYCSEQYIDNDRVEFRINWPTKGTDYDASAGSAKYYTAEKLQASLDAVQPNTNMEFTSLKTGYAGYLIGKNGMVTNVRFDGEEQKEIAVNGEGSSGTESYILGLNILADLGDLSGTYSQNFLIKAENNGLKRIKLGNEHKNYYNPYQAGATLGLAGSSSLEEIDLTNCLEFSGNLDLSDCPQIKTIKLSGSSVSSLTLPPAGVIEELRIPTTVTNLRLDNYSELKDEGFTYGYYEYPEDEYLMQNGKYVNDYKNLVNIYVANTDIDSYAMVRKASALERYYFEGINWVLTDDDTQYCRRDKEYIQDNLDVTYYKYDSETKGYVEYDGDALTATINLYEKVSLIKDNRITSIPILEYLIAKAPVEGKSVQDALSGTLTIDISEVSVSEYDIYQKYHSIYPNLDIKYSNNTSVDKAYKINFYNQEAITENSTPYYTVLGTKDMSLKELTSANGPTGNELKKPSKLFTNDTSYEFSGYWKNQKDGNLYNSAEFDTIYPTADMSFTATFLDLPRQYDIKFYDYNNEILLQDTLTWNTNIKEGLAKTTKYVRTADTERLSSKNYYVWTSGEAKFTSYAGDDFAHKAVFEITTRDSAPVPFFVYKEDNSIGEFERWALKGWINEKDYIDGNNNPSFYNMDTQVVNGNFTAYAFMHIEDVRTTPSNMELFMFDTSGDGVGIKLKSQYADVIRGKVTLPLKTKNGSWINAVASSGFKDMPNITHIYFEQGESHYTEIRSNAFEITNTTTLSQIKLVEVNLPDTITSIGNSAFRDQRNLRKINLPEGLLIIKDGAFSASITSISGIPDSMQIELYELPSTLTELYANAFYKAGSNVYISKLPDGLKDIPLGAFTFCDNVAIGDFGSDNGDGLETIGSMAFYKSGNSAPAINTVTFRKSVRSIDDTGEFGVFGDSYLNKTSNIVIHNNLLYNNVKDGFTKVTGPTISYVE